jgi:hypothetical protein
MVTRSIEEYRAAAMLLGMSYDHRTNTFYTHLSVFSDEKVFDNLDADTLEPVGSTEYGRRIRAWFEKEGEAHIWR